MFNDFQAHINAYTKRFKKYSYFVFRMFLEYYQDIYYKFTHSPKIPNTIFFTGDLPYIIITGASSGMGLELEDSKPGVANLAPCCPPGAVCILLACQPRQAIFNSIFDLPWCGCLCYRSG